MKQRWAHVNGRFRGALESAGPQRSIFAVSMLLILLQLGFRTWALLRSWFYLDDYQLLREAQTHGLSNLMVPHNSHLMPAGRFLVWVVEVSGQLDWTLACLLTLGLQAASSLAALWMLHVLFGWRWGIVLLLVFYLFSPMTIPAFMWWTAELNQLSMQFTFFVAVGAWVEYLRGRRLRRLAIAVAAIAFSLAFDVKVLLVAPVLLLVAYAYFARGAPLVRLRFLVRRYWAALLAFGVPLAAYTVYYSGSVSQPFEATSVKLTAQLAGTMLGTAFATSLVGGPWSWAAFAPPNAFADPPAVGVHLAWVAAALVVAVILLRRRGTGPAWLLLTGYLALLFGLLVTSRGPTYGPIIGLEYRYLTDAVCAVVLALGLACLPLAGSVASSMPRSIPLLLLRLRPPVVFALAAVFVGLSLLSSIRYADIWHSQNPSNAYMHTLQADLRSHGRVDLVDQNVPDPIFPAIFSPDSRLSRLAPLVGTRVNFPSTSANLAVVADDGGLRRALIQPGVVSKAGPRAGCGWPVRSTGLRIPLTARAFNYPWWVRIGYVASKDSRVTIAADGHVVHAQIQAGLNSLYFSVTGTFDSIRVDDVAVGALVCVDTVEVGTPVPGQLLP